MLVALVATILIVAFVVLVFLVWIYWAWTTEEKILLRSDDDAELRGLFEAYCVAVEKAAQAAKAASKPLEGEALQRFLDADAEAMIIVRRIKEIRTSRNSYWPASIIKREPTRGGVGTRRCANRYYQRCTSAASSGAARLAVEAAGLQ